MTYLNPDDPRWVYIFTDAAGEVLYVGCTGNLPQRIRTHAGDKPWFGQVAHIEAAIYPNEATGAAAEQATIRALRPRYEDSPLSAKLRQADDERRIPCRKCRRSRHGECLGVNSRGQSCRCQVCAQRDKAAS